MDNSYWTRQGNHVEPDPMHQHCAARAFLKVLGNKQVPGWSWCGEFLGLYQKSRSHWYGKSSPNFAPSPFSPRTFPACALTIGAWSYLIFNDMMAAHTNAGGVLHLVAEPDAFDGRELPPVVNNPVFCWYWTSSAMPIHPETFRLQ